MRKCGLYLITNKINGNYYGGSSIDIDGRWRVHKSTAHKGRKNVCFRINAAIEKYGINNFEMKIILICSPENLLFYEQLWLDKNCGNENCYNIATIAKAPFTGNHHSDKTKRKIANAMRGRKVSDETRKRLSIATSGKNIGHIPWNCGKKMPDEFVEKMRNSKSTKLWSFINPEGNVVSFYNLTKFCKDNNLSQGSMWELYSKYGRRSQHKGWRAVSCAS